MTDAVIDQIDGRMIRIGDRWLADFASCNYLGFDLDREIIDAVPGYLERWGTHPSWSRLLGSPVLYEQIEEHVAGLLAAPDALVFPTITLIHLLGDPAACRERDGVRRPTRPQDDLRGRRASNTSRRNLKRFEHGDLDELERLLRNDKSTARLICIDGVNSMTGNVADLPAYAALTREYDAILYVDDAHGFGVIGERSRPVSRRPTGYGGTASCATSARATRTSSS